jgi:hypothetical protein
MTINEMVKQVTPLSDVNSELFEQLAINLLTDKTIK